MRYWKCRDCREDWIQLYLLNDPDCNCPECESSNIERII